MAIKKIDSILDTAKINAEFAELGEQIEKGYAKIVNLYTMIDKVKGTSTMSRAIKDAQEVETAVEAANTATTELTRATVKLAAMQTEQGKAAAIVKVQQSEVAKANKESAKEALGLVNAYDKLEKQFKEASRNAKDLAAKALIDPKFAKEAEAAAQKAKQLNDQLKNIDATVGQYNRNVGNYEGSAKIIVDALEKERKKLLELEQARVRVQNAGGSFNPGNVAATRTTITGFAGGNSTAPALNGIAANAKTADQAIEMLDEQIAATRTVVEGFARVTENPKFLNIAGKVGDANAELKFFTKALIDLERQGLGNSEAANELRQKLAQLTDQISDAKAEIKALSSDTRGFDLFAGSVSFAADAFQTFAGAAVLAGASEEDAAEATKTLVAVQSVANGVKGIANELTTRGTAANKVYALSQELFATATNSSATATARLAAGFKLLGAVGILAVITVAVASFSKLKDMITGITPAQKALNETVGDYQKGAQTAIESTQKVALAFDQAKSGVISKDQALKIYNETLGDSFGKTNNLAEAERLYNEKAGDYIKAMGLRAQANALFTKSAEAIAKGVTAAQEDQIDLLDKISAAAKGMFGGQGATVESLIDAQAAGVEEAKKQAKELGDALFKEGEKLANQAEQLAKKGDFKLDPTGDKDAENKAKKALEDRLKQQIDAEKKKNAALRQLAIDRANEQIRIAQKTIDDENSTIDQQLAASKEIAKQKKLIAAIEFQGQIEAEKEVKDGKIRIVKKSNEEILVANQQLQVKRNTATDEGLKQEYELNKAHTEKLKALREKELADSLARIDQEVQAVSDSMEDIDLIMSNRSLSIARGMAQELANLDQALLAGNVTAEEYAKERADIEAKYAKQSTEMQVEQIQAQMQIIKNGLAGFADAQAELEDAQNRRLLAETDAEREAADNQVKIAQAKYKKFAEYQKQYNELAKQLLDEQGNVDKEAVEKEIQRRMELADLKKTLQQEVYNLATSLLNAQFENELAYNEEQQAIAEENYAREVENINNSTLNEAEKQKELARLAKEKETRDIAFENKQREIKARQARFEKARAIAEIAFNAGVAIIRIFKDYGFLPGLPLAAAMGAIAAAQIQQVTARQIPQYAEGTDNHPGGPAVVGEGKNKELVNMPGGKSFIADKPMLLDLPAGTKVKPLSTDELNEVMHRSMLQSMAGSIMMANMDKRKSNEVADAINMQTRILARAYGKNKPVVRTTIHIDGTWGEYLKKNVYN